MIGYVTVGTNDLDRAAKYYDRLFALIGAGRFMEEDTFIAWASSADAAGFAVTRPNDGNPATVGNGMMVALAVDSKEKVHEVYDKAIEMGSADEGPAGPRSDDFYAGYFRDLDGNKLCVFWVPQNTN